MASGHVSRMTTLKLLGILRLCLGNPSTTASAWTAYGGRWRALVEPQSGGPESRCTASARACGGPVGDAASGYAYSCKICASSY
jgi:hypothetical protein